MTWINQYTPPSTTCWQGRNDLPTAACFFQTIQLINLLEAIPAVSGVAFGFIGFCCDEGIRRNFGRPGAASGPRAIREALAKLPIPCQSIVYYDAGDIICTDDHLEEAQAALAHAVNMLLHQHIIPIVLGGGHELAWGHYQGIAKCYPDKQLGIVNFDAHFDMRPLTASQKGSSGTPFLQIAKAHDDHHQRFNYYCIGIQEAGNIPSLFTTAKQYQVSVLSANDLHLHPTTNHAHFIENILLQNEILYVSLCLDVFAAADAPGVSAPQPLGLTPWQVVPLLRHLAQSGKVMSYDIAEMSPTYDIDQRTAKLAAHLIYEMIHSHTLL